MVKCTSWNGPAWSTQKKYTTRCKGTIDFFFGVQHRLREEEVLRFESVAARITDENASSEDRRHASGGVFAAIDSNLRAVIGKEGAVTSIPGNEGISVRARYACLLRILLSFGRLDSEE